ncbi:winged helix-turn-helix domain-containing protein [Streptomyces sp. NPDC048111]|uniref:winged helix-turn-helix domain-containing protein n=1 Tax=Streptomyces sp. NPDC048111 TaxID=3365500 RepID=UPI003716A498
MVFCSFAAAVGGSASRSGGGVVRGGVSHAEAARAVGVCAESVRRWRRVWEKDGACALWRRASSGRPPRLDDSQVEAVRTALEQGARAHGFEADLWTLERVGEVVARVTGVVLSRASVWRLLTGRLGWSLQRPERRAVERDASEIARWVAHEWPRIRKGREHTCLDRVPRRIRRLTPAASPPHLRAPRSDSAPSTSQARQLRQARTHRGPGADEGVLPW